MRRFIVEEILENRSHARIRSAEARHISRVLRMGPGERIILIDGKGLRFEAVIESASSKEVAVLLETPLPAPPPSPVEITLCQCLIKPRLMDLVVQKASELGVDSIIPFTAERTVVRLDSRNKAEKKRHWMEITRASAAQSDRVSPALIDAPVPFEDMMERFGSEDGFKCILWEQERSVNLKTLLKSSPDKTRFTGVVGPEGGFTENEICLAREAGFISASLGRRVLRSETAGIALVALIQYEWGDLGLCGF